jgi:hypothetical protein
MTRKQFPGLLKRKNKREHKSNHNQKTHHQRKQQRNIQEKSPQPAEAKTRTQKEKNF